MGRVAAWASVVALAACGSEHADSAAVSISAVEPGRASFRGGTRIRIEGSGFEAPVAVTIGGAAATIVEATTEAVVIDAPPAASGGSAPLVLESAVGRAEWPVFAYEGIDPRALVLVGDAPLAAEPFERAIALAGEGGRRRLVFAGHGRLHALEPAWTHAALDDGPRGIAALCASDLDGDGREDLWIGAAGGGSGLWRAVAAGAFEATATMVPPFSPSSASCFPGLVIAAGVAEAGAPVLATFGAGTSTAADTRSIPQPDRPVTGLDAADVDGDGDLDLVVGREGGAPRLLLHDGHGVFVDAPGGSLPAGASGGVPLFIELDGDGPIDLILASPQGHRAWLGIGGGRFVDQTSRLIGIGAMEASSLQAADIDADGSTDLLVVGSAGSAVLYRNDGNGRLYDYTGVALRPGRAASQLADLVPFDVDRDGDLDLAAVLRGAPPRALRNWDPLPLTDPDLDGIPAGLDNCPDVPNPDQANTDGAHFSCASEADCAASTGCELLQLPGETVVLDCRARPMTNAAARDHCARRGARLFMPPSVAAQEALGEAVTGSIWIDLTDAASEGEFVTPDGTPPRFTAWNAGEPNDSGGKEDCTELIFDERFPLGIWNDVDCAATRGFVCLDMPRSDDGDPGDACDVCPLVPDPDQLDSDGDGAGDACESGEP